MTEGQKAVKTVAEAVVSDKTNTANVRLLQEWADVSVDGVYGPETAGVVQFVLQRTPPPTRSGRVTPYDLEMHLGSVIGYTWEGFEFNNCRLKGALESPSVREALGESPTPGSTGPDLTEENLATLRLSVAEWDDSFVIGDTIDPDGVPYTIIYPGVKNGLDYEGTILGWIYFETHISTNLPCSQRYERVVLGEEPPQEYVSVDEEAEVVVVEEEAAPAPIVPPPTPIPLALAQNNIPGGMRTENTQPTVIIEIRSLKAALREVLLYKMPELVETMTPDGVFDAATKTALGAYMSASLHARVGVVPYNVSIGGPGDGTVVLGDNTGNMIAILQEMKQRIDNGVPLTNPFVGDEAFQAPTFAVNVPEEAVVEAGVVPTKGVPTWLWITGGLVVLGGVYWMISKKR